MDKLEIVLHPTTGRPVAVFLNGAQIGLVRYQINYDAKARGSDVILVMRNVDVTIQEAVLDNESET